jgi:hypothetical protein
MCKRHWYAKTEKFARFRGRFYLNKNLVFLIKYRENILLVLQESSHMTSSTVQGGVLQIHSEFISSNYKFNETKVAS